MTDIFITYASADRDCAKSLTEGLQARGWSVWCDRVAPPDRQYGEVVLRTLKSARCVVVLWSSRSVVSARVCNEAATRRRVLIAASIEPVVLPTEFEREQPPLDCTHWKDGDWSMLFDAVEGVIGPPRAADEPPEGVVAVGAVQAQRLAGGAARHLGAHVKLYGSLVAVLVIGAAAAFGVREYRTRQTAASYPTPLAAAASMSNPIPDLVITEQGFTADADGCKVANPHPKPNETVKWSGACVRGKAFGPGSADWFENGQRVSRVKSEWKDGKPGDHVVLTDFTTNETFDGEQVNGKWNGKVTVVAPWGRLEGNYSDGVLGGFVTLIAANGRKYEGDFSNNKFNGRGKLVEPDGARYTGDFVDGKFHGRGVLITADGKRYEGQFAKGEIVR